MQLSDDKIESIGSGQFNNHSNQVIPKHKPSNVNNATKQHSVLNIDSLSAQSDFQSKVFDFLRISERVALMFVFFCFWLFVEPLR